MRNAQRRQSGFALVTKAAIGIAGATGAVLLATGSLGPTDEVARTIAVHTASAMEQPALSADPDAALRPWLVEPAAPTFGSTPSSQQQR